MKVDIIKKEELKDKKAYRVKEDVILNLLREIKKRMGTLKGNELYVGESSLEEYKKKRGKFRNTLIIISFITVVVLFFGVFVPLLSMDFLRAASGFALTLVIAFLLFLFALLHYVPAIEESPEEIAENKGKEVKEGKDG